MSLLNFLSLLGLTAVALSCLTAAIVGEVRQARERRADDDEYVDVDVVEVTPLEGETTPSRSAFEWQATFRVKGRQSAEVERALATYLITVRNRGADALVDVTFNWDLAQPIDATSLAGAIEQARRTAFEGSPKARSSPSTSTQVDDP